MHNHLRMEIFAPIGMLYNILLPINCYIGNITTKSIAEAMSNNRELSMVFYHLISSDLKVIAVMDSSVVLKSLFNVTAFIN